jgi:hypothetical protein
MKQTVVNLHVIEDVIMRNCFHRRPARDRYRTPD